MTSSTDASRSANSGPAGTSNGIRCSARVRLARTIRWAMVGSAARKARAISSVVRPPSSRNVRATRPAVGRIGWQEMKISRSRSSPTSLSSSSMASSISLVSGWDSRSRAMTSCLRSSRSARLRWSMARRLAMAISQAPGLSGTPDVGHRSSAATSASCANSSARPTSRTIRVSPAMTRPDSSFQTASIVRWASRAVTALIRTPRRAGRKPLLRVLRPVDLVEPALAVADDLPEPPGDLDHLGPGPHFDQREPADRLLRLGERPVGERELATGRLDARTDRVEAAGGQQHALLGQFVDELAHLDVQRLVGLAVAGVAEHEKPHGLAPCLDPVAGALSTPRTGGYGIDTARVNAASARRSGSM